MEYFIWDGYFPGSGHAFAENAEGISDEQTTEVLVGMKLSNPPRKVRVTELSEGELPDLMESSWSSKMVSAKLKKILEKNCPDCIQYIPVTLEDYPDKPYWIANVLTSVSCIDRDKSRFSTVPRPPHTIRKVNRLVLKPIADDAPAVFRMEEIPSLMLVSEVLRKEFEAASSSPGKFTRAQDFRWPSRY